MDIRALVDEFAERLGSLIEDQVNGRARALVDESFGGVSGVGIKRLRKKVPPQLCPVPKCTNNAAPVYGMVCAQHKDVPKAKIEKYRLARRTRKLKAAA